MAAVVPAATSPAWHVNRSRRFTEGDVMSDPMTSLRDRTRKLGRPRHILGTAPTTGTTTETPAAANRHADTAAGPDHAYNFFKRAVPQVLARISTQPVKATLSQVFAASSR